MFKPVRIVATIVFLAMIGLIFVGAFVIKIDVSPPQILLNFQTLIVRFAILPSSCASVSRVFLPFAAVQPMTNHLISLRYPRVPSLYVVYALLHPLREDGCAQVLWNVTFISASD